LKSYAYGIKKVKPELKPKQKQRYYPIDKNGNIDEWAAVN
jgi:hypothetical protein